MIDMEGNVWSFLSAWVTPFVEWRKQRRLDKPREKILKALLKRPPAGKEWITMETLSRSIAADEHETARLLFRIGARRSTKTRDVWALKSRKRL